MAKGLMLQAALNKSAVGSKINPYQDTEFDNPFNTNPPTTRGPFTDKDGVVHQPALSPDRFVPLKLLSVTPLGKRQSEFAFSLPKASQHTACLSGQYVQVRLPLSKESDTFCKRHFSPVNATSDYGRVNLVLRFESRGQLSLMFQSLKPGKATEGEAAALQ